EALLADHEVHAVGQSVALVVADSLATCRAASEAIEIDYEPLPAILNVRDAIEAGSFLTEPHCIRRGDPDTALQGAALRLSGEYDNGGQDHFYLETQAALAIPEENGNLKLLSSTQHPSEVQSMAAAVLGLGRNRVTCEVPRMGGAFGGKESQATQYACLAALGAMHTGRAVKLWLNRDQDMLWTGNRHPFHSRYEAGFDAEGRLLAFKVRIWSDGGWSQDLSGPVLDRALFHLDNAYFIPHLEFEGRAARTNLAPNTAFRGFGGPQGMLVVEDALNRAAERLDIDPAEIRRRNYYGDAPRDTTPYGQVITDCRLARIHDELTSSADYRARQEAIDTFNQGSRWVKRALGFGPVKFGISFTASMLNQAGALVLVYADGTVQLNHGGTEMGQGLHSKMLTICSHELGVPSESVRVMHTATDKVPNTSATAASSGSDLNGEAVREACKAIRERLRPIAAGLLGLEGAGDDLDFADGHIGQEGGPSLPFAQVSQEAWLRQISLSATGYYRTPDIAYDRDAGRGKPFHYFAYGSAITEVEVHGLTGEFRVTRVDILHDAGDSLVPTIDIGQVEGGYIQGLGWLTTEELVWDSAGALVTHSPSTYKIPAVGDAPVDFRVALLTDARQQDVIHGSKAVGEPPLMLAISAVTALRQAILAFASPGFDLHFPVPATPEAVLRAVEAARRSGVEATDRSPENGELRSHGSSGHSDNGSAARSASASDESTSSSSPESSAAPPSPTTTTPDTP
ncbi:MAG TPA: xanthine dehydrogenase molybdopterin binding subunit, partial [Deltaproteobacteria bacterium]|nr:xanthine dehydrogenase molybdopterin binding subunit [Deltaproteobacteria bacterium]